MLEKRVKNLADVVRRYRRKLEEKVRVQRIILFGSYARGKVHDYSDIDLAIISPDFHGGTRTDYRILDQAASEVTPLIEAFPYTPKDLKHHDPADFLAEILRTGKVVYRHS